MFELLHAIAVVLTFVLLFASLAAMLGVTVWATVLMVKAMRE